MLRRCAETGLSQERSDGGLLVARRIQPPDGPSIVARSTQRPLSPCPDLRNEHRRRSMGFFRAILLVALIVAMPFGASAQFMGAPGSFPPGIGAKRPECRQLSALSKETLK